MTKNKFTSFTANYSITSQHQNLQVICCTWSSGFIPKIE